MTHSLSFVPGTDNEARASYTSTVYDAFDSPIGNYDNKNNITSNGGLLNSNFPDDVYGLWANVGASQAYYDYYEVMNDQVGLDLKVSTDIGNHAVRFGLSYEQRRERFYGQNADEALATDAGPLPMLIFSSLTSITRSRFIWTDSLWILLTIPGSMMEMHNVILMNNCGRPWALR
ncbi:MAG: hypothetical protein U5L09_03760 [Bacteroidales bacterium]|nr:hypothetical protein [Bacteroidales bacterium]